MHDNNDEEKKKQVGWKSETNFRNRLLHEWKWSLYNSWMMSNWSDSQLKKEHQHPQPLKLGICCSYYLDVTGLTRQIKSLNPLPNPNTLPWFSLVYFGIDGRYFGYGDKWEKDYEHWPTFALSTDGSRRVLDWFRNSQYAIKVVQEHVKKPIPERQKRQMYVDMAAEEGCDAILIIDADEYFEPRVKWKKLALELERIRTYNLHKGNVFCIKCVDLDNDGAGNQYKGPRPRIWFNPQDMEYKDRHYKFGRKDSDDPATGYHVGTLPEDIIQIYHNPKDCRSESRLEKQRDYESRLSNLESID